MKLTSVKSHQLRPPVTVGAASGNEEAEPSSERRPQYFLIYVSVIRP